MKAIILNSGVGNRMGELTHRRPKCLVELCHGETILSRQVDFLAGNNITDIVITTGPFQEKIKDYLKEKYGENKKISFTYIYNELFQSTNYIYSLYLAKDAALGAAEKTMDFSPDKSPDKSPGIEDEIILMHGDLVFTHTGPLKLLNSSSKDTVLVDSSPEIPEKDFKCRIEDGHITKIAVDLFGPDCRFLFPMYKLSTATYEKWLNAMENFVAAGKTNVYAENALNEILHITPLKPLYYKDEFCAEVDDEEDLNIAKKTLY